MSQGPAQRWHVGDSPHYTCWSTYRVSWAMTPEGPFYLPFLKGTLIGPRFAVREDAQAFCESHAARLEHAEAKD